MRKVVELALTTVLTHFYIPLPAYLHVPFQNHSTTGTGFRVFDGGGGDDDAVSGLMETDRHSAQSNDRRASQSNDRRSSQSNDRRASQSNDRRASQSNDRRSSQSNGRRASQSNDRRSSQSNVERRELRGHTPESEVGLATGGLGTGIGFDTGFESGLGLGMGLDVFGRLANTSTTHIHRSPPSKQQLSNDARATQSNMTRLAQSNSSRLAQSNSGLAQSNSGLAQSNSSRPTQSNKISQNLLHQTQNHTFGRNDDSGDHYINEMNGVENEINLGENEINGAGGGTNEEEGVSYLAREDEACVRWMDQHTLLTASERLVAIAASTKVPVLLFDT